MDVEKKNVYDKYFHLYQDRLADIYRDVLSLRYGNGEQPPMTYDEISDVLNINVDDIRYAELKGLRLLSGMARREALNKMSEESEIQTR